MGCYPTDFSESRGGVVQRGVGGGGGATDSRGKVAKVVHERGCTEQVDFSVCCSVLQRVAALWTGLFVTGVYGVATISRLLQIKGLFCKRAL